MYELSGYIVEEHWIGQRLLDRERKCIKKIDAAPARIADETCAYCEEAGKSIGLRRFLAPVPPVPSVYKPRSVMRAWERIAAFRGALILPRFPRPMPNGALHRG